ncbi:MAG: 50S ribosomal protein L11 methyltransferase [Pseudomonadota bacterium]
MAEASSETALRALIERATAILSPPLLPELRFHGAADYAEIWSATERTLDRIGLPPPFWAFAWPGGQALARLILDAPERVRGRTVLAIGAGAGLEAIAAAQVGAARAVAADIDPAALVAARLNASLNGVALETEGRDLLAPELAPGAPPPDPDLILLGDAFYEADLSARMDAFAAAARARGAEVWIAGPERPHPTRATGAVLAAYDVPVPEALEDATVRRTRVVSLA